MNEALPADVLTVVAGDREVGARLSAHPDVDKMMFTGSTATGKAIIRARPTPSKRLTLELGGNDAGIVLPDADPKRHRRGPVLGRLHQHRPDLRRPQAPVRARPTSTTTSARRSPTSPQAMPMGNGLDEANVLGPLQNRQQFDIVTDLVEAARDAGATC